MFRLAETADIPALTAIWQEAFGDEKSYIESFLDVNFKDGGAVVYEHAGEVCAAAHLVPSALKFSENAVASRYIYAVAVSEKLRENGIGSELMQFTVDWLRKNELTAFLVPANDKLYGFYRRFGFTETFGMNTRTIYAKKIEGCRLSPIDAVELLEMRESFFAKIPHEVWDERRFCFIKSSIEQDEGQFLKVCSQNAQGYMLCYKVDSGFKIREHTLNEKILSGALCELGEGSALVMEQASDFAKCSITGMALVQPETPAWLGYDIQ